MNKQDKAFMTVFGAVLGVLVGIAVVIFIVAQTISGVAEPDYETSQRILASVEKRLEPVGRVVVAGSAEADTESQQAQQSASAGSEMSGEQVYNNVCSACHAAGVLNAPKVGDNAAWSERYQQGLDTLLNHALNGFNQMPAKGGNTSLSEQNVHDAIVYMLQKSDIEVAMSGDQGQGSEQSAAATDSQSQGEQAATDEVQAGAASSGEKQAAQASPAASGQSTETSAEPSASGGAVSIPDGLDLAQGEQTYQTVCMACHQQGVAGAPKLGDTAAWKSRLAQGWDTLSTHVLQGYNAMPPKGGRPDLPDEQVLTAMGYMISQVQ